MAISLKEGDRAPFFRGINQEGKEISLNDYKGKKIILYFMSALFRHCVGSGFIDNS